MVPDVRHVVIGQTPANRANRLISMLIHGPSTALTGAVSTQFTAKSALRSNPVGRRPRASCRSISPGSTCRPRRRAGRWPRSWSGRCRRRRRGSRSPSTARRSTRRSRSTRSTRCPRSTPTGWPAPGRWRRIPFYVNPGRRDRRAAGRQPMPGPLGSGAAVGDQRGEVVGDRADRRGGRRPRRRPGTADGPPPGDRPGRPGAEGRHPHAAQLHPRRRRGVGGPERRDQAGGVPGLDHREPQPGAGRLRRVRRQGTGHGAGAVAGRRPGRGRRRRAAVPRGADAGPADVRRHADDRRRADADGSGAPTPAPGRPRWRSPT